MAHDIAGNGKTGLAGPIVVGGIGGSGTRVLTHVLRRAGVFVGDPLTSVGDSLPLLEYHHRWVGPYLVGRSRTPGFAAALEEEMRRDLFATVETHLAPLCGPIAPWGWKHTRSILILPFLNRCYPTMKFVHVIRDGRDMAFSDNRNVLNMYGVILLTREERDLSAPRRAIRIWSRVNLETQAYGRAEMSSRYMLLRFEDLCDQPLRSLETLFEFIGLDVDCERIARDEIRPPRTLGRFRRRRTGQELLLRLRRAVREWAANDRALAAKVERDGTIALREFGY
jgi:hypothetical protein